MKLQDNDILFEDNHLLCVYKPFGLATQPSLHNEESLEGVAKEYIKTTYNKPGNVFLHAVHRLDKVTSGIVIFAKTSKALSRLNETMRKKDFEKTYQAVVEGIVTPATATLEHMLIHGEHKALVSTSKEAKKCLLSYKLICQNKENCLVEVDLETGRYHQIRAQFAAIGHPVVGDSLYGAKQPFTKGAIALWHTNICFTHPVTNELITVSCKPKNMTTNNPNGQIISS
jgi:23S rRNA pseudouridine1911/1915/1917 synthase